MPSAPTWETRYSVAFFSPSYLGKPPNPNNANAVMKWRASKKKLKDFGFPSPEGAPAFQQTAENQMPGGADVRDIAPSASTTSSAGSRAAAPIILEEAAEQRESDRVETGSRQPCQSSGALAFVAHSRAKHYLARQHPSETASPRCPESSSSGLDLYHSTRQHASEAASLPTSTDRSPVAALPSLEEAAEQRDSDRVEMGDQQSCQSLGSSGRQHKRIATQCKKQILAASGERQCLNRTLNGNFCWLHKYDEEMTADPR